MTDSMKFAISETNRRREIQEKYNEEHNITPTTIKKAVRDLISISKQAASAGEKLEKDPESMTKKELQKLLATMEKQMKKAAADLNFEAAMEIRDQIRELSAYLND